MKLASTRYLDNLHTSGDSLGRAFRDLELEEQVRSVSHGLSLRTSHSSLTHPASLQVREASTAVPRLGPPTQLVSHTHSHAHPRGIVRAQVHRLTQKMGIGAQFGGKYFCHDVRVVRLPRHGASVPIGLGVSCSADRQAVGKITKEGVFLEALETDPSKYLPEVRV